MVIGGFCFDVCLLLRDGAFAWGFGGLFAGLHVGFVCWLFIVANLFLEFATDLHFVLRLWVL